MFFINNNKKKERKKEKKIHKQVLGISSNSSGKQKNPFRQSVLEAAEVKVHVTATITTHTHRYTTQHTSLSTIKNPFPATSSRFTFPTYDAMITTASRGSLRRPYAKVHRDREQARQTNRMRTTAKNQHEVMYNSDMSQNQKKNVLTKFSFMRSKAKSKNL